jgi:2-polyprenyl-6-methoxyphenol hydroxylase-like FAD-dependent oxidoreductase
MNQSRRALIVGGGIGGLSAAISLLKVGFDVDVFEQSPTLREAGAGVGLWSNAMGSLDQLGAGATIRRNCLRVRVFAVANEKGRNLSSTNLDDLGADFVSSSCFVVLRPMLLAALAECVPQKSIHTDCRVVRLEADKNCVRLHLEDGRVEEGDLLVGADGLHSVVRPLVVGHDDIRYSGQTCFRGVAPYRLAQRDVVREVQGAGQRGSVCPVDAENVYWWVALNAPAGQMVAQGRRKSFLLDRFKGWPSGLDEAIAATPDKLILQNDLVDRPPALNYAKGNVVLVGDAAHPTTPNLGQGANMAIDDAIVLGRCLRDTPTISMALEKYQRERLPRTRQVVQRSWSFGRMCLWESKIAVTLRELIVRTTPRFVIKRVFRWQVLEGVGSL